MEQKNKNIGTTKYLVTQMDAIRALKVQTKLVKILGAGALSLMSSQKSIQERLKEVVPALMENFDDEAVTELVLSLFEKGVFTEEKGVPKPIDFSTHFAGKAIEMWKVVAFIMETNFSMGESLGLNSPTTEADEPQNAS